MKIHLQKKSQHNRGSKDEISLKYCSARDPSFSPTVGTKCKARFAENGNWYNVTIEEIRNSMFMVKFGPKYRGWVQQSDLLP
jgi:hypothetical protein